MLLRSAHLESTVPGVLEDTMMSYAWSLLLDFLFVKRMLVVSLLSTLRSQNVLCSEQKQPRYGFLMFLG